MTKVGISTIKDIGNDDRERVIIPIPIDCNIGRYVLLRTKSSSNNLIGAGASAYWFPNREVKSGDTVVLYTKKGIYRKKEIGEKTSHFFYWGLAKSTWSDPNVGAALGTFTDWTSWRNGGFDEDSDLEPD